VATYRLSAQIIGRSKGRSSTAAAAYRAGERIVDLRSGLIHDYRGRRRRQEIAHAEILAPANSPDWVRDRSSLWNAVEATEKRKDAQLCREILVSLPHELTKDERLSLLRDFITEQFVSLGMVADFAIHRPDRKGDERNHHAHILLTMRELSIVAFGKKVREWNPEFSNCAGGTGCVRQPATMMNLREAWATAVNRSLQNARLSARVDHRSLADQGIDREPEPKQGSIATKLERAGRRSKAGDDRRAAQRRNLERARLQFEQSAVHDSIMRRRRLYAHEEAALTMRNGAILDWKQWRIHRLSEEYELDMTLSPLARYWRLQRTDRGLVFFNERGRFEDRGEILIATTGCDLEISAMLRLAQIKAWPSVHIGGTQDFKRRAVTAALARGLSVSIDKRDRKMLADLQKVLSTTSRPKDEPILAPDRNAVTFLQRAGKELGQNVGRQRERQR